ncbi:NAD dependent epimerase/dehydratase family protein [Sinomonas atrocyanea]|uniref:NAD dependent epimerase/dehydratase family protein n=1 Tax=Sinomonas atrocyanea TaxID=37927 RepID=A0A126ZXS1_9MICC|nr:NAD-dependent epimerase/dehydratase family protein [Sinomonas atrocyanea]AMM31970.1 NAD dependent epimerase/dehydratase family protein [Sinomonas atrocyanea]GEB65407.1 UDP-sulfoquinovose synthase [Sinomonas atrocyanea]GGG66078.1 UDP-sulfoquinovose synthase [Sinomonas atrocyanea]
MHPQSSSSPSGTIMVLGGDGYLGWTLGLALASRTGRQVVLVDNLIKRRWEKEAGAKVLVPLKTPKARIAEYERLYGGQNLSFEKVELLDPGAVERVIAKYRPAVVINAAQQPSAPFSMSSAKNAAATFSNNIVGHLNVLWAIAGLSKATTYIKLGSAGCYMGTDTDWIPLEKKDFTFEDHGAQHQVLQGFLPMQATDFYHQSKITDLLIDDLCSKIWGLKVITVQQATIFGATIPENHPEECEGLAARFNYDSVFGTVFNRFVCQMMIGHPLTVYGDGSQKTGLISLADTVENFLEFTDLDVAPGEHQVLHNYTHRLSISEIAQRLAAIDPSTQIRHLANPRQEPVGRLDPHVEVHEAIAARHADKEARLQADMAAMLEFTYRYRDNIDPSIILPTVEWSVEETEAPVPVRRDPGAVLPAPAFYREVAEG